MRSLSLVALLAILAVPEKGTAISLNDAFHILTTPVVSSYPAGKSQGTGFFYHRLEPADPNKKGPHRRAAANVWLITNRHILLPRINGAERLPSSFTFHLRRVVGQGLKWEPVVLKPDDLKRRARFHTDLEVDIAVLEIQDLMAEKYKDQAV